MKDRQSEIEVRELTHKERVIIRKLVIGLCANYCGGICLPLDCPCYMMDKRMTGAYCRYFQDAILPLDSMLEASLMGYAGTVLEKMCPVCGAAYIPVTSQVYCSAACRAVGQREADRRRQQRHRRNGKG